MSSRIKVSVCVVTYNQEKYIAECLQSLVDQKVEFKFEIIIHDDASTDGTKNIIMKYHEKYPTLIKPIFQKNNQYSINGHLPFINTWEAARGEYIALCEGDDYWISPEKLQIQFDIMKLHPNINISFHPSYMVTEKSVVIKKTIFSDYGRKIKIYNSEDVLLGGGGFMPTQSLLIKADVLKNLPVWFEKAPVGDFYIQIISSIPDGALYIPSVFSAYRVNALGSWSSSQKKIAASQALSNVESHIFCLNSLESIGVSSGLIRAAIKNMYLDYCIKCIRSTEYDLAKTLINEANFLAIDKTKRHRFVNMFKNAMPLLKLLLLVKQKTNRIY